MLNKSDLLTKIFNIVFKCLLARDNCAAKVMIKNYKCQLFLIKNFMFYNILSKKYYYIHILSVDIKMSRELQFVYKIER